MPAKVIMGQAASWERDGTMLLVTTWFGTFLLDGKQVADSVLFPKEAKELAARLRKMEKGEVLDEERGLAQKFESEGKGGSSKFWTGGSLRSGS